MRYIGLDIGKKNIGVAVGEMLAAELGTYNAPKDSNFYTPEGIALAIKLLAKDIKDEEVGAVVVGLPVDESGNQTPESKHITQFCEGLKKEIKLPFFYVDETLTSFMAADMLEEQGLNQKEIDEKVHQMAATLILQQYLEENATA